MRGVFGPILTTGVVLGTAAVVVANPVNPPRDDIRIPALAASDAGADADLLDHDFLRALAPEPAGPTNPVAVLKDLVAVLVASAAYLGRNVVGAEVGDTAVRPELTAASYPYFGDAPGWRDIAPLVASGAQHSGDAQVAPTPFVSVSAPSYAAVQDWVDADLRSAFDRASAVVSELPDALPVVGDSALSGTALRPMSEIVGSVKDSVADDLTILGDLPDIAVSTVRSGLQPSPESHPHDFFADAVDDTVRGAAQLWQNPRSADVGESGVRGPRHDAPGVGAGRDVGQDRGFG